MKKKKGENYRGCKFYEEEVHAGIGRELNNLYQLALPVYLDAPDYFYRKFIIENHDYTKIYNSLSDKISKNARTKHLAWRHSG